MALLDEKVEEWILQKFLRSTDYDRERHGPIPEIKVISVDGSWECCCYSEWTRDDEFILWAEFEGAGGRRFSWNYGRWGGLPDLITELDEYVNGNECSYEEDDY